jgi:hypothetical protein
MKINWKVLVALTLMVGAIALAAYSIRSKSFDGANLNFEVGSGMVTMTNPSTNPIPVKLANTSIRSFSVSTTIDDVPSISVRDGERPNVINLIEFELPPGVSEFTITRGSEVSFIADTTTNLEATVQAANISTKIQLLAVFLLGALFYMSYTTEHRWIYKLLGREPASKRHAF